MCDVGMLLVCISSLNMPKYHQKSMGVWRKV